jgi:hypothetical protein
VNLRRHALPLIALLLLPSAAAAARRPVTPDGAPPTRTHSFDIDRRIDVNRVNMFVTNFGAFGFNLAFGDAGLFYPKGQPTSALFAGGLWLGAPDPVRVTVAEYSQEYAPGRYELGVIESPALPELKVFKMARWTGAPSDSQYVERTPEELAADPRLDPVAHHSWAEYREAAIPRGAPSRIYRLPVTDTVDPSDSVDVVGPDVRGDQMLWSVFNDADPGNHTNGAGNSEPLGVEVRHTTYAFERSGPLGDAVFLRWEIRNGSTTTLDLHPGIWTDPDLGQFTDDLIGCDVPRRMGYVYNGDGFDDQYGTSPPALGIRLLDGPMPAFTKYINGTDPASPNESFNLMRGLDHFGDPIVDPTTGLPTTHMHPGDPIAGTGWLDANPADRRMMVSAAPRMLPPGETTVLEATIVIGRSFDHRRSIEALRCHSDFVAAAFASGFTMLDPPAEYDCPINESCGLPASEWETMCAGGLPEGTLQDVAGIADATSAYFEWGGRNDDALCWALHNSGGAPRVRAEREFAALLANAAAAHLGLEDGGGDPFGLSPGHPVSCAGVEGTTVADLLRTGSRASTLREVVYVDGGPNRRALTGVNFGLPHFFGGAGFMTEFFGSTLDPTVAPDSFATVEIRFGVTQKAYRYLRHERLSDTGPPPAGRRYSYAGFHDVPFQVWDVARGVQLEAAFVEKVVTDDDGTILPPAQQPASHDSTWGPSDDPIGDREYLFVLRPAYSGVADPAFEVEGLPPSGVLPALYVLTARLRTPTDVIDPEDRIAFGWGRPLIASVDQRLIELALLAPDDPAVIAEYQAIAACLEAVNASCDGPTAALATLAHAHAEPGEVRLEWHAPGLVAAVIERAPAGGAWSRLATVAREGRDRLVYVDRDVEAGGRYGYRLRDAEGATHGEAWIDVPTDHRLALAGTRPHPAGDGAVLAFTLPRRAPARLEILDVAGRRVAARDLGALEPGAHALRLGELDRLPVGVYLARLVQGAESVVARIVRIR